MRETPGMAERRVAARLSVSRLKRKGERILPCAMPESTQGEETEPPRRTSDRVPQRKPASRCQRRPVTQSGFDPAGVKSLLNVDERGKGVLMAAEAQGVHKAEGHSIGTPAETAVGRVELWKNVGRNARVNEVLENFESARCERNERIRIKGGGGHHRA